jgi:SAM-dependent methyltransferase
VTDAAARRFFDSTDPARWGRPEMPEQEGVTRDWIARAAVSGPSLELGCGRGSLAGVAPGYAGIDLAFTPLVSIDANCVQGDMEQLPFRDAVFGFAFTWAALEHVPHPERVLGELERVLKPGGVALLAPAWHCRPWAAEGLEFRPYDDLTLTQRIRKRLIPFRNNVLWRAVFELPHRISRELRRTRNFEYGKLKPNLEEFVGTDCDAFSSMDPQSAALYFHVRGWEILSHPTLKTRMLARHEPVVIRKPARR